MLTRSLIHNQCEQSNSIQNNCSELELPTRRNTSVMSTQNPHSSWPYASLCKVGNFTCLVFFSPVSCFAKCRFVSQILQCRCWEWLTGSGVPWQTSITRRAPVLRLSARYVIVSIIEVNVSIINIIVSIIDIIVSSISIDVIPPLLNIKAWNGLMKNAKKSQV